MTLRRRLALAALVLPLLTAGCGTPLTPEVQCFADTTIGYRAAWRGAAKIRADLARGYALHRREIKLAQAVPCRMAGTRGTCLANGRETLTIPVAIDRAAFTKRLATLEATMNALRPAAIEASAPCDYTGLSYGESVTRTRVSAPLLLPKTLT